MTGGERVTVRVRVGSEQHRRLYTLRAVADLADAERRELVELQTRAAKIGRGRRGVVAGARVLRILGRVVELVVADIEPNVVRRLPLRERQRVCAAFVDQAGRS